VAAGLHREERSTGPRNWARARQRGWSPPRAQRRELHGYRRPMRQWLLDTAYAERLGDDLEPGRMAEPIQAQQRKRIGPSDGAVITLTWRGNDGLRIEPSRPGRTPAGANYKSGPWNPEIDRRRASRLTRERPNHGSWRFMAGQGDGERMDTPAGRRCAVRAYQRRTSIDQRPEAGHHQRPRPGCSPDLRPTRHRCADPGVHRGIRVMGGTAPAP